MTWPPGDVYVGTQSLLIQFYPGPILYRPCCPSIANSCPPTTKSLRSLSAHQFSVDDIHQLSHANHFVNQLPPLLVHTKVQSHGEEKRFEYGCTPNARAENPSVHGFN